MGALRTRFNLNPGITVAGGFDDTMSYAAGFVAVRQSSGSLADGTSSGRFLLQPT